MGSCSVYFFDIDANRVADQMRTEAQQLLARLEEALRENDESDDEERQEILSYADEIFTGKLPDECEYEHFEAFHWLMGLVGERIELGSFLEFRRWAYFEDIGIWPWLKLSRPPFPAPDCEEPDPQTGFLSASDIKEFALPAFDDLPSPHFPETNYSRQEFKEVLKSLVKDKLDLLAVLMP